MKRDPFSDPPTPLRSKRSEEASVQAAAKVFFFVLIGTVSTILIATTVALWRWII